MKYPPTAASARLAGSGDMWLGRRQFRRATPLARTFRREQAALKTLYLVIRIPRENQSDVTGKCCS
jgi:hypothetical protein